MSEYFPGTCDVASRNPSIHEGATNGTNSPRFAAEGVALRRYRVLTAASDVSLATANLRELFFMSTSSMELRLIDLLRTSLRIPCMSRGGTSSRLLGVDGCLK